MPAFAPRSLTVPSLPAFYPYCRSGCRKHPVGRPWSQATKNLAQTSKAILATMAAQLDAFDSHFGNKGSKPEGTGLSTSEAQKLASLGYVGLQRSSSNVNPAVNGTDPKDSIALANEVLKAMLNISEGK